MSFNFLVAVMGNIESRSERGPQRMRSLDTSMDTSLSKLQVVKDREAWSPAVHRLAKCQTRLSD